jgi:site-specific recombinase XerD
LSTNPKPKSDLILQGTNYSNFINALSSPATKVGYENSLRRYMNFLKLKNVDDLLLHASNTRLIESQIIDYIMSLRTDGLSHATIQFLIAPLFTFYNLNDVFLNRKRISRYLGEFKRVVRDEAYSNDMILQSLQGADQRMRMIILLMSSTGARIGSLPSLQLRNLNRIPEYGLYKIVFYEGTNNEYYSFCTRECAKSIDDYLEYRQSYGEKIFFDESTQMWEPSESPLIRLQFDINDLLQARNPQPIVLSTLRQVLTLHLIKCGLRRTEHPTAPNSTKRIRKPISLTKGFRKHVISTFIEAGLNHEIRELIVDHNTQLDQNYFRPSEEQVLAEYLKAEPYLTVDPNMRLKQENRTLKINRDRLEERLDKLEEVYRNLL